MSVAHRESRHDRSIVHQHVVRVLDLERLVDNDTNGGGADSVVGVEVVLGVGVLLDGGRGGVGSEEPNLRVGLGLGDHVLDSRELDGIVSGVHEPRCLDGGSNFGGLETDATTRGMLLRFSLFLVACKYETSLYNHTP
jgi:hypothetical protein